MHSLLIQKFHKTVTHILKFQPNNSFFCVKVCVCLLERIMNPLGVQHKMLQ